MQIDENGINMLCNLEGFRACPYQDSYGIWTIGIGTTILPNGIHVTANTPCISRDIALQYVNSYMSQIYLWLNNNLRWKPNQNQWNALCSFLYNIGLGANFNKCILTKQAIISGDIPNIIIQMKDDNNGGLLTKRRQIEVNMFNS